MYVLHQTNHRFIYVNITKINNSLDIRLLNYRCYLFTRPKQIYCETNDFPRHCIEIRAGITCLPENLYISLIILIQYNF